MSNSNLPTLFQNGTLVPHMNENKNNLDKYRAIDYILEWFDKRIPIDNKSDTGYIKAKGISDRVVILKSGTGSAKSTGLAPYLFMRFNKRVRKSILITQPRVLTTLDIPKTILRISAYKDSEDPLELGKNIGYQTQEFVKKPIKKGILFTTTGILLQFIKNLSFEDFTKRYKFIIIDEVHDRTIDVDLIMYSIKQMINNNPINDCPFFILMSATINISKYTSYFDTNTVFEVNGKSFPVDTIYLNIKNNNYIDETCNLVLDIHKNNKSDKPNESDILIFCSGIGAINKLVKKLESITNQDEIMIIPLDSTIFKNLGKEYKNMYIKTNKRKVIISTNIAETGVTIESLKYCIDTGYVISVEYNPNINCNIILNRPVDKNMATQRKGRVGRVKPGVYYAMYSKQTYDNMNDNSIPDIFISDISNFILNILCFQMNHMYKNNLLEFYDEKMTKELNKIDKTEFIKDYNKYDILKQLHLVKKLNVYNMDFFDVPSYSSISIALEKLFVLGFITQSNTPTPIGILTNKIRMIPIEHIRILISGYKFETNIMDLITIIALINTPSKYILQNKFRKFEYTIKSDDNNGLFKKKILIGCSYIDFLLFLNEFLRLDTTEKQLEFCENSKVYIDGIYSILQARDDIIDDLMNNFHMDPYSNTHIKLYDLYQLHINNKFKQDHDDEFYNYICKIKSCLYEGLRFNLLTLHDDNKYYTHNKKIQTNVNNYIVTQLPLFSQGRIIEQRKPKYIIFDSMKLSYLMNQMVYETGSYISVLDGFIDVDTSFITS